MKIYTNASFEKEASSERLKRIHGINERMSLKKENEETACLISSKNTDFVKTWSILAHWSEMFLEMLKKGNAFRAEIYFDPEADIAEINMYEKITGEDAVDKRPESSGE